MKRALILLAGLIAIFATAAAAGAQDAPGPVVRQGAIAMAVRANVVEGAPYSGTITTEMVQTLADGNRIVQSTTGSVARDSQGRTRQDAPLPPIGNLSAENAPHIVFIQDPVAKASYTLNLTDKTAQKMPMPPAGGGPAAGIVMSTGGAMAATATGPVTAASGPVALPDLPGGDTLFVHMEVGGPAGGPLPPQAMGYQKAVQMDDSSGAKTEDLGTQTMEGLAVTGTRTTRTIPAGQIGNERPLEIVTEVWTSPDLKTIVSSKRSDPRMGEQTFQLTNVTRAEPEASLFTVPPDFKIVEGPQKIVYGAGK